MTKSQVIIMDGDVAEISRRLGEYEELVQKHEIFLNYLASEDLVNDFKDYLKSEIEISKEQNVIEDEKVENKLLQEINNEFNDEETELTPEEIEDLYEKYRNLF